MEMMKTTTKVVNDTSGVLKLKMGGPQHYVEVATIEKQGRHDLHVNVNETYREFLLQAPASSTSKGKSVIITSDDCCDYECITIKQAAGSGKFEAHYVARKLQNGHGQAPEGISVNYVTDSSLKVGSKSTWFGWLRQLWAPKSPPNMQFP